MGKKKLAFKYVKNVTFKYDRKHLLLLFQEFIFHVSFPKVTEKAAKIKAIVSIWKCGPILFLAYNLKEFCTTLSFQDHSVGSVTLYV